jgi:hypothetical protein
VEKTLQPAAQEAFGSRVTRLRSASGYNCRNRIGSRFHLEKLSEHALANAIDISGFVTADGRIVEVARHWGPTVRDQREAEKVATTDAKDGGPRTIKGEAPKAESTRNHKISAIAHAAIETPGGRRKTAELENTGKGVPDTATDPRAIPATTAPARVDATKTTEARFLRRLHTGACGTFGTVLGPEANEAHRDHFHFDLAHRRTSAYCQ